MMSNCRLCGVSSLAAWDKAKAPYPFLYEVPVPLWPTDALVSLKWMTSVRSIWITGFLLTSLTEAQTWGREREAFEGEAQSSSSYTLSHSLALSGYFLRARKESNISSCHQGKKWQQMSAGMWEERNSCSRLVGGRTCTAITGISIEVPQQAETSMAIEPTGNVPEYA